MARGEAAIHPAARQMLEISLRNIGVPIPVGILNSPEYFLFVDWLRSVFPDLGESAAHLRASARVGWIYTQFGAASKGLEVACLRSAADLDDTVDLPGFAARISAPDIGWIEITETGIRALNRSSAGLN